MKRSGYIFENNVEEIILSFPQFSDDYFKTGFLNVFNYKKFLKQYDIKSSEDLHKILHDENDNIFLMKNCPVNLGDGKKPQTTEFGIYHKYDNDILKWRIECKFQKVVGTTYQKIEYAYKQFKESIDESFFLLVYDGDYFRKKPIIEIFQKSIRFDFNMLALNINEFKSFFSEYLVSDNPTKIFTKYHYLTKKF